MNNYANATVPRVLHLVWSGKHMPEKYLHHLEQIAAVLKASRVQVNLWVDGTKLFSCSSIK